MRWGAAILNRLPDGFLAEALSCMNRNVEILALDIVKRIHMFLGKVVPLPSGNSPLVIRESRADRSEPFARSPGRLSFAFSLPRRCADLLADFATASFALVQTQI